MVEAGQVVMAQEPPPREEVPNGPQEPWWRRAARPALSAFGLLAGAILTWNLALQSSNRFDHILGRPSRWVTIALLATTFIALCIARWKLETGRRRTLFPTILFAASFLALVAYWGNAATLPCRATTGEILGASLVLCAAALISALMIGRPGTAVASAGFLLFMLLMSSQAYAHSCASTKAAQSTLRNALVAAQVYREEEGSFEGFTPAKGAEIEPSLVWLDWGDEPKDAWGGVVRMDVIDDQSIILVTTTGYGEPFCLAQSDEGTFYGESSSNDPALCAEDSW